MVNFYDVTLAHCSLCFVRVATMGFTNAANSVLLHCEEERKIDWLWH